MSSTRPSGEPEPSTDPAVIEAEIARTRAQIKDTVDELSDRLNPKNAAAEIGDEIKLAVTDLKRRVTGDVRPADEPEPPRRAWIVLGAGAAVVVAVVSKIVRKL